MRARVLGPLLVALAAVSVWAVAPARDARAATVSVAKDRDGFNAVYYVAAPGEVNDVVAVGVGDARVRITDTGADITAGDRCRSIDAHNVVCRSFAQIAHVAAGDLDDRVRTLRSVWSVLSGGPGDDELVARYEFDRLSGGDGDDRLYGGGGGDDLDGGGGDDRLYGGGNEDRLDGGGGQDELYGESGSDHLTDGDRDGARGDAGPGRDRLVGGTPGSRWDGGDTLSYAKRRRAVRVHAGLDTNAGKAGERDRITGIENVVGGSGDDRIIGNKRTNYLYGRRGADILIGRRGKDTLTGGRGPDRLRGGHDPDKLAGGAGGDALFCGPPTAQPRGWRTPRGTLEPARGDDVLLAKRPRLRETVPRSCEQLLIWWNKTRKNAVGYSVGVRPQLKSRPSGLRLRTACPDVSLDSWVSCRGTVRVRETRGRRQLLAIGRFSRGDDGASFNVPLVMTSRGYDWWAGRLGKARATVALRVSAEATPKRPFKWTIRAPR